MLQPQPGQTVTVRDWHTDPIGEISLRHPARPGLLLVWRNQLCTDPPAHTAQREISPGAARHA